MTSPSRRRKPPQRRSRWRRRLLLLVLAPFVLSALLVLALRWLDPPGSAFMLAYRLSASATAAPLDYRWVALEHIDPHLLLALVAAEDQRFPVHSGFDLQAIQAALRDSGTGGRGASTISQQLAKNLFLWRERSWWRKGLEVWFTLLIEALWDKRRILEVYANLAEFGPGVYGVEAAAQRYFDRSAAEVQPQQAARLAAVLPSPLRYSVTAPGPYVRRRAAWVEQQMHQLGGPAYLQPVLNPR